jgi:hypothetical protein
MLTITIAKSKLTSPAKKDAASSTMLPKTICKCNPYTTNAATTQGQK